MAAKRAASGAGSAPALIAFAARSSPTAATGVSAVLRDQPQFLYDISLPIKDMMKYVEDVKRQLEDRWPGSRLYVLGHIGDGNLHFFISPGREEANQHAAVDAAVYEPLVRYGGGDLRGAWDRPGEETVAAPVAHARGTGDDAPPQAVS